MCEGGGGGGAHVCVVLNQSSFQEFVCLDRVYTTLAVILVSDFVPT